MAETETLEQRVAELESQLAALTATTPTEYYTHQYSGEEIDAAVGRAVSGGALDTSVENVSKKLGTFVRPNLLDNWYFGNPVNQRGQTGYTGNVYSIDRWKLYQSTVSVTVRDDGLGIKRSSGDFYTIVQYVDNSQDLAGKTVTFSALITSAPGAYRLRILAGRGTTTTIANVIGNAGETGIKSVTATLPDNVSDLWVSIYTATTAEEYVVAAVKLELGDTQTLAHQDSAGNWVLNEVPDYGEQLRRCKRYFYALNSHAFGWTYSSNIANMLIPLPVTMRTTPTVTAKILSEVETINGAANVTNAYVTTLAANGVLADVINPDNAFVPGTPVVWHNFDITLSADL